MKRLVIFAVFSFVVLLGVAIFGMNSDVVAIEFREFTTNTKCVELSAGSQVNLYRWDGVANEHHADAEVVLGDNLCVENSTQNHWLWVFDSNQIYLGSTPASDMFPGTVEQTLTINVKVVAPDMEVEEDPLEEIRSCNISRAIWKVFHGTESELDEWLKQQGIDSADFDKSQYLAYTPEGGEDYYSLWAGAHFATATNHTRPLETDVWGNPLYHVTGLEIIDDVPLWSTDRFGPDVRFSNDQGYSASYQGDYADWYIWGAALCAPLQVSEVAWAEEPEKIAETRIEYFNEEGEKVWYFEDEFFLGKVLSPEEFAFLFWDVTRNDGGSNWAGTGFIGGGSSSHGNYDLIKGDLAWANPNFENQSFTYTPSFTVTEDLPLYQEIVVITTSRWGNYTGYEYGQPRYKEAQRFILWEDGGETRMLETDDVPAVDFDGLWQSWLRLKEIRQNSQYQLRPQPE